jgi:hypothetical protein
MKNITLNEPGKVTTMPIAIRIIAILATIPEEDEKPAVAIVILRVTITADRIFLLPTVGITMVVPLLLLLIPMIIVIRLAMIITMTTDAAVVVAEVVVIIVNHHLQALEEIEEIIIAVILPLLLLIR